MILRIPLLVALFLWLACLCFAGVKDQEQTGISKEGVTLIPDDIREVGGRFSLFDPERFSLSHRYTLSYFTDGEVSGSLGLYQTSLRYEFSSPLSLRLDLGYLHRPPFFGASPLHTIDRPFLSAMELQYRPKDNFFIQVNVGVAPQWSYRRANGWFND